MLIEKGSVSLVSPGRLWLRAPLSLRVVCSSPRGGGVRGMGLGLVSVSLYQHKYAGDVMKAFKFILSRCNIWRYSPRYV